MAIIRTTFRMSQRVLTGPEGFRLVLRALREVLPYCQIDLVQLDRFKFAINWNRYPRSIWFELLHRPEWHDKLIFHLASSLAESDHVRRMAQQAHFARLATEETTRTVVHGTILYESEGTPELLRGAAIPQARMYGCELQVDAYTEHLKRNLRRGDTGDLHDPQRELYHAMLEGGERLIQS
jgi:hypothetical protein